MPELLRCPTCSAPLDAPAMRDTTARCPYCRASVLLGERGGANFESNQIFADQNGYMMTMTPAHLPEVEPFAYKMRHFVEVARGQRYNEVPPEHGLMVQQMLDAVYASAERGGEVLIA